AVADGQNAGCGESVCPVSISSRNTLSYQRRGGTGGTIINVEICIVIDNRKKHPGIGWECARRKRSKQSWVVYPHRESDLIVLLPLQTERARAGSATGVQAP